MNTLEPFDLPKHGDPLPWLTKICAAESVILAVFTIVAALVHFHVWPFA